jgi:hypothetical protein
MLCNAPPRFSGLMITRNQVPSGVMPSNIRFPSEVIVGESVVFLKCSFTQGTSVVARHTQYRDVNIESLGSFLRQIIETDPVCLVKESILAYVPVTSHDRQHPDSECKRSVAFLAFHSVKSPYVKPDPDALMSNLTPMPYVKPDPDALTPRHWWRTRPCLRDSWRAETPAPLRENFPPLTGRLEGGPSSRARQRRRVATT